MKLETEAIKVVFCSDWDRFVEKVYSRPYCFQQQQGCRSRGFFRFTVRRPLNDDDVPRDFENDTVPEIVNHGKMGVSFLSWLARDPNELLSSKPNDPNNFCLKLWWKRNFYPHIDILIEDLRKRGLLEVGEYGIIIDW